MTNQKTINSAETLQQQLHAISGKVDALHEKVEGISVQIAGLLAQKSEMAGQSAIAADVSRYRRQGAAQVSPEHRDVLVDSNHIEMNDSANKPVNPDLQLQRLMAQLTAAYNRIAALEEQLLSQRLH